jgi:ABC-type dipeptide/oligopeptide/nickel transport system ATPase component
LTARSPTLEPPTVLAWDDFARMFFRTHRQGEHVAIVGPTGSGKSVLGLGLCQIIAQRKTTNGHPTHVAVLANKPKDRTMSALGWPRVREWPPGYGQEHCVVWPKYGAPASAVNRQAAFYRPVLQTIFAEGGQTVYVDEIADFEEPKPDGMGLKAITSRFWKVGRSLDLTFMASTQRPRSVARPMWSEPSWVFIFRLRDLDDVRRVGEIAGDRAAVVEYVSQLGGHEFLVVHDPSGSTPMLYVSRVG